MSPQQEQQLLKAVNKIGKALSTMNVVREEKEYITIKEAAERFNYSERTIRQLRYEGRLTDFKHSASGRKFKYSVEELEKVFEIKNK